jgi:hypothetical protein
MSYLKDKLKIIKEMREEGNSSESELLDFAVGTIEDRISEDIIKINKQVSEGINSLKKYKEWSNLSHAAKHAMDNCFGVLKKKKNEFPGIAIINIIQFKRDILKMGKNEFWDLLSDKAKEKYFGKDE